MSVLPLIERTLRRRNIPPSRFGRDAVSDPRIVYDMRRGREPRPATVDRLLAHVARLENKEATSCAR